MPARILCGSLICLLLASTAASQADDFVSFKRCYLDTSVSPAQFRPYSVRQPVDIGQDKAFLVRRSFILRISEPEGGIAGIPCVRLRTTDQMGFVQGSMEEVWQKLQR